MVVSIDDRLELTVQDGPHDREISGMNADLDPVPRVVAVSSVPATLVLGESFDLIVDAMNDGGVADIGLISVSFPTLTAGADTQVFTFLPGSSSIGPTYSESPARAISAKETWSACKTPTASRSRQPTSFPSTTIRPGRRMPRTSLP